MTHGHQAGTVTQMPSHGSHVATNSKRTIAVIGHVHLTEKCETGHRPPNTLPQHWICTALQHRQLGQ